MKFVLSTLLLLCSLAVNAAPVWKVSQGGHHLYLVGTIHLLSDSDYPLPNSFELVFQQADKLVFEVDLASSEDQARMQRVLQPFIYGDEQNLSQQLQPATLKRLTAYLASRNLTLAQVEKLSPALLSLQLTIGEMQRLGMAAQGVDGFYYQKARAQHKNIAELETLEQQFDALASFNQHNADELVLQTLDEIGELPNLMLDAKQHWRSGNIAALYQLLGAPMLQQYPQLYQQLLVQRNHNWLPQLQQMLTDEPVEMVLVGALHLGGEHGLLQLLSAQGYQLEQL